MEGLNRLKIDNSIYKEIESVSRDMCFALHRKRIQLLDINVDSLSLVVRKGFLTVCALYAQFSED